MAVNEHWVVLSHPAWGHVRHMNGFLARTLRRRRHNNDNLGITYLLHHTHAVKAEKELRQLLDEEGETSSECDRLCSKVLFIGLVAPDSVLQDPVYQARYQATTTTSIRYGMEFDAAFVHQWDGPLTALDSITCGATRSVYSLQGWAKPSVLHTDIVSCIAHTEETSVY
jgi:hypothetical protein